MKKTDLPSKMRFLSLIGLVLLIMISCLVYHNYYTYNSIKVVVKDNAAIVYGSPNYNLSDLIKKVDGEIVSVKNNVDTNVIGEQEVIVEVKKDNFVRDVPIILNVVDTAAPEINLFDDVVYITHGDIYDVNANINSVNDNVDGFISYNGNVDENSTFYYNFSYNAEEISGIGEHKVTVIAKDKTGNTATKDYTLVVEEKKYYAPVYYNAPSSQYGGNVVGIAYSLVGAPYIGGANGPYGFDCSGFVQYVYSRVGVGVSRSAWSQLYDGVGVSYDNMEPGDIISWGYGGYATHSALYVGNGQMIHAANPSTGVIISSVGEWSRWSGTSILSIRRVN